MDLQHEIEQIAAHGNGKYGIAAKNISTGEQIQLNANEVFNTASVIKVMIMAELFRRSHEQTIDLAERIEFTKDQRVEGSGLIKEFEPGVRFTLRDLCIAMIAISDNSATNMLITRLGKDEINGYTLSLGLRQTVLNRPISFAPLQPGQSKEFGITTPNEIMRFFEILARGEIVSPKASEEMIHILSRQQHRTTIPRMLPVSYSGVTGESEPLVANKTGSVSGVRNDVALIRFSDGRVWIISAFSKDLEDLRWSVENTGQITIAKIARTIYDSWAGEVGIG